MQSISKIVAYAYLYNLYELKGKAEDLHNWVGDEPNGLPFNSPSFDKEGRPHNPMVNAGAIMVCTLLVNEGKSMKDFQNFFKKASSAERADIDQPLYLEESMTGTTNHALRSLMLANRVFPEKNS